MERSRAIQIGDDWHGAAEESGGFKQGYRAVQRELAVLLSDSAEVGLGFRGSEAVVLALDGQRLIRIDVIGGAETHPLVRARSISLAAEVRLDVAAHLVEEGGSAYMKRSWTLGTAGGESPLEIETRQPVSQSFAVDRGGDALMRKVARKLGWPIAG